ncbi:MAG TPA: lasso peptide biosynthesis B2 protein [Steroidobacter sp.]
MTACTVLLDLERNRYFGIGTPEARALLTLAENWCDAATQVPQFEKLPPPCAAELADALVSAGFLSQKPPVFRLRTERVELGGILRSAGHELQARPRLRPALFCDFLRSLAWARRALRSRSLYSIACEISRRKERSPAQFDEARALELVAAFRRMRPHVFAAKDKCLLHALALTDFLARQGIHATWVIGVRTRPWGAHSWVQQGTLLMDASPEQVCEYMPILAV